MYKEFIVEVTQVLYEDEQIQLLNTSAGAKKAMLYRAIHPPVQPGERLLVNGTAVSLSLGTGGWDIVKAVLSPLQELNRPGKGHIMKARYLPSQHSVLAVESQESEDHSLFLEAFSLRGRPVLLAELHSVIPIVYLLKKRLRPEAKMTVIISDEAALPLVMSSHLRVLHQEELFSSITVGQAFGGTFEAVTIQTALQFAYEKLQSDLVLVTLGPGVVGTGTTYGFSGMAMADWANTIGSLSGVPVWIPRVSFAEKRNRHVGLSHHTLTPLCSFTHVKSVIPLPSLKKEWANRLITQIEGVYMRVDHQWVWDRDSNGELDAQVRAISKEYPTPLTTMGRSYEDDPAFFLSIATATKWVLSHLDE